MKVGSRRSRFVWRPLFLFLVFLAMLVAVFQATGRFALATLELYEEEANRLARTQNVNIEGLSGSWRYFNPIVKADRIVFPGGYVEDVLLEVDVIESALRSVPLASRLVAAKVFLDVVETDQGWQLRGAQNQPMSLDIEEIVRHSDHLEARVDIRLTNLQGVVSELSLDGKAINRGVEHQLALRVANSLEIDVWQRDEVPWYSEAASSVQARGFLPVPEALIGQDDVRFLVNQLYWHDAAKQGGCAFDLQIQGMKLPGADAPFAFSVVSQARRVGEHLHGDVTRLAVEHLDDALEFPPIKMRAGLGEREQWAGSDNEPQLQVWLQAFDVDALTEFVQAHLKGWDPVGRWVSALSASGEIHNLHAYFDQEMGFGYGGSLADLNMTGYKGAPTLTNGQGQFWGHRQAVGMQLNAHNVDLKFPDLFHEQWKVEQIQGSIRGWFGPGYFALRGEHLRARIGESSVSGRFSLSRPDPRYEQRVGLSLNLDKVDLNDARAFVPYKIPDELAEWLGYGPQQGNLSEIAFVYHGQVHTRPDELGRRIELKSNIVDGVVQYDRAWPLIEKLSADIHVAGVQTRVALSSAQSEGIDLTTSDLVLEDNGAYAKVAMHAKGDASRMLAFVHKSPLKESMSFVSPEWQGGGVVDLDARLSVPIKADQAPPLAVDLRYDLTEVVLDMPEYRTRLEALSGQGTYELPHQIGGELRGRLFGEDAAFKLSASDHWVHFDIDGTADDPSVFHLIDYENVGIIEGSAPFSARLNIAMTPDLIANLTTTTQLQGMEVRLPGHLAKASEAQEELQLDVQFLETEQSISFRYKDTQGWVHYSDQIDRGAIGIGSTAPMTQESDSAILISGVMDKLVLSEWVSDDGDARVALPLDWTIRNLAIDQFVIDELVFDDIKLSGAQRGENVDFAFKSENVTGSVALPEGDLLRVDLAHLRLPVDDVPLDIAELGYVIDQETEDPISVEVGANLPAALVKIDQLDLGDEPFGRWEFEIRPVGDVVEFRNFAMDVNGVHVEDGFVSWNLASNESAFAGRITLDDLGETLPQWDYAATLTTDRASIVADSNWGGSPANVSLLGLNGNLIFNARDGRFLEVESGGGLKIMSLLNFSNIAKRISFDFSDVTKNGFGFDKLYANVQMSEGSLQFVERMTVESSSSNFQVGGQVDLNSGTLANEMIVTLPVSDSLPWYGVYLALANPLAGLGVVIGERVLRKPLRAVSTAKFEVAGTLDEPDVKFVSLWDQSMSEESLVAKPVDAGEGGESD